MIELLLIIVLSYSSGYGHRYFTAPKKICNTVDVFAPEAYTTPQLFPLCKEGIDPITGLDNTCMTPTPRYVLSPNNLKEFALHIQGQRGWLNGCIETADRYNKKKFRLE